MDVRERLEDVEKELVKVGKNKSKGGDKSSGGGDLDEIKKDLDMIMGRTAKDTSEVSGVTSLVRTTVLVFRQCFTFGT